MKDNVKADLNTLIGRGWMSGIVKLDLDPEAGHGLVCFIGPEWFYFGGTEAEDYDRPSDYLTWMSESEVINDIILALSGPDPDGWKKACIGYLVEHCINDDCFNKYDHLQRYLEENYNFGSDARRIIGNAAKWAERNLTREMFLDFMAEGLDTSIPSEIWDGLVYRREARV